MVKISYWTRVDNQFVVGHFVATLSNGLCIRCQLVKGKSGSHFVSLPQRKVPAGGDFKWMREVYFENQEQNAQFKDEILRKLKEQEGIEFDAPPQELVGRKKSDWDL